MTRGMVDPGVRERIIREACLDRGEKSLLVYILLPVPQTDTGREEEDSKANGRRVVKELGKLIP